MDAVKRTRLDPAQRRAQLIDLGARMLAERPLEQISVEDIADQAGVSRGLLFHYFASKSEFHLAIVRHSSEQMLQRTEPSESDDPMLTFQFRNATKHFDLAAYRSVATSDLGAVGTATTSQIDLDDEKAVAQ